MEEYMEFYELVALFKHPDKEDMLSAKDALEEAGKATTPELLDGLKNGNSHTRSRCAWVLGKRKDESTFEPLVEALSDPASKVRAFAAGALGELKKMEAVPHLIRALGDENYSVRMSSAWALSEMGDGKAIRPLCGLLRDKDGEVVKAAIHAIHKLEPRDERDVRFLEHCIGVVKRRTLTSSYPGLRGKADLPHRTLKKWSEIIERRKEQEGDIKKFFREEARRRKGKEKTGNAIRKLVRLSDRP